MDEQKNKGRPSADTAGDPVSQIRTTRMAGRRSFLTALGVGLAGTAGLLLGTAPTSAQRWHRGDQKYTNDADYYRNGDIKDPIANQARGYMDGDRARPNDFKHPNDRD